MGCKFSFDVKKNCVEIIVTNTVTNKEDRYLFSADEQGSTYHLLLQAVTKERAVGLFAVRELTDNIGDALEDNASDVCTCDDYARSHGHNESCPFAIPRI